MVVKGSSRAFLRAQAILGEGIGLYQNRVQSFLRSSVSCKRRKIFRKLQYKCTTASFGGEAEKIRSREHDSLVKRPKPEVPKLHSRARRKGWQIKRIERGTPHSRVRTS
jgi:hypothetical protein